MTTGGCQCGQVRFEFDGPPMNQVFCYCTDCQKRTGSDKWFGLWVKHENLHFLPGHEPATYTVKGSSGRDVHQHFCPTCAVTVCADMTAGGFYTVAASSLDDGFTEAPKAAIFVASAPSWAVFPEGVPTFDRLPPM